MTTEPFGRGGYRYIPGPFQYSAGVVAESGHAIERVSFRAPLPLPQGFARVAAMLSARGRPLTAFCACELRSPAPMSDAGFRAFNETYVAQLAQWGIYDDAAKRNPVARSNVCPKVHAPGEPSLHAFSFTVAAEGNMPTFVVSEAARPEREELSIAGGPSATGKPAPMPCARRPATCWPRWSEDCGASASPGPIPRRRRSIPCMNFTPSMPRQSPTAVRRTRA